MAQAAPGPAFNHISALGNALQQELEREEVDLHAVHDLCACVRDLAHANCESARASYYGFVTQTLAGLQSQLPALMMQGITGAFKKGEDA